MVDAAGALLSVHARNLKTRDQKAKARNPIGFNAGRLVFADPLARRLLLGESDAVAQVARVGLLVTEGVPAYLKAASSNFDGDPDAPAVIGFTNGGWTQAHADRVPLGAEVLIVAHDDPAGRKYTEQIAATLVERQCRVRARFETNEGPP
jgi:hypothetical protein